MITNRRTGSSLTRRNSLAVQKLTLLVTALSLAVPKPCFACLWDYDTLAMERQAFPQAHELIAGVFVRHSDAYYEWRIADRTAKPVAERSPIDFDDLAVAYDKLGQHDKAIETIRAKIERWPDERRYESEANLGTFLIHAGRFEEGLPHINKAIEINPEAHFGREVYQKLLVDYVIERRASNAALPLDDGDAYGTTGFAKFVLAARNRNRAGELAELRAAAKGIMGMMRFGRHDSPILLEALGDLLVADGEQSGSKRLAARAYLKAAYEVNDPAAASAYREKATSAIYSQHKTELPEIEAELKLEIERGNDFFNQIADDEKAWSAAGKNLDQEFAKKYYGELTLEPEPIPVSSVGIEVWMLLGGLAALIVAGLTVVAIRLRNMRRQTGSANG